MSDLNTRQRHALELLTKSYIDDGGDLAPILQADLTAAGSVDAGVDHLVQTLMGAVDLSSYLVLMLRQATGRTVPEILSELGEIVNRETD